MIVTTTPTIQDGQVLRWYPNENAARFGDEIASASRKDVLLDGPLRLIEPILADVRRAHERLARREDVTDMAAHRTRTFGEIEPIVQAEAAPDV